VGVVRAAVCESCSAEKKSVLMKFLLEARDGEADVVFHTRVRGQI